ncbi:MAG: HEAT repeat domain-containing protein [Planctomycetes bacterium]|nr:HEAT repeat domain-containing protein [Planctomycetota bacterium]
MRQLTHADAIEVLNQRLRACATAHERNTLIQLRRRLDLNASPLALAAEGSPSVEALRAARSPQALVEHGALLADFRSEHAVREAAAQALGNTHVARAREILVAAAASSEASTRRLSARALGRHAPHARARRALSELCHDSDLRVSAEALRSLGGWSNAARDLEQFLLSAKSPSQRAACLDALQCCGRRESAAVLESFATSGDPLSARALRVASLIAVRTRGL